MAALDFPSSPSVGQSYTSGNGTTYYWNGNYWATTAQNVSSVGLPVISETITSGSQTSVTISNIPQGYRDLKIVVSGRGVLAANNSVLFGLRINGDTGTNYINHYIDWQATSATTPSAVFNDTAAYVGYLGGTTSPTNSSGSFEATIFNYTNSSTYKVISADNTIWYDTTSVFRTHRGHQWKGTASVTSLVVFTGSGNFADGSIVTVYGIGGNAAANTVSSGSMLWTGSTAPPNPVTNPLWWKSDDGVLLIYYNDGNSSQWVNANQVPSANTIKYTKLQRSSTQSYTNSVSAAVSWDTTVVQDDISAFNSSTPTYVTVPTGYTKIRVSFNGHWASNSTGARWYYVQKNGSTQLYAQIVQAAFESSITYTTQWLTVAAGDQISTTTQQGSGGTLNFAGNIAGYGNPYVQFEWMQ